MRVGLKFNSTSCPVLGACSGIDGEVTAISKDTINSARTTVEEIVVRGEDDLTADGFDKIFEAEDHAVYRFERSGPESCACDQLESYLGFPISNTQIKDDKLLVWIYVDDVAEIKGAISTLRDGVDQVSVVEIDRSTGPDEPDPIRLDRFSLTERQREVYRTAYEMGYFEATNRTNATDVANAMDLSPSTVLNHLRRVQAKIAEAYFRDN